MRFVFLLLVGLAASCGGGQHRESGTPRPIDPERLLAAVPADTPYLLAALEPGPKAMKQFMQSGVERSLAGFFAWTAKVTDDDRKRLDPWTRFRLALFDDLRGKPASELWPALGIDITAPFVFYGLGPWPVFRFALHEPAKLRKRLDHAFLQTSAKPAEIGGRNAWIVSVDGFDLVVAVLDREGGDPAQLVLAMVPGGMRDKVFAPPAQKLGNGLADVTKRHKLSSRIMQGFIDLRRAVAVLQSATLDESMRRTIAPIVSACGSELDRVAAAFPRVVFGYRAVDDVHFDATVVLEAPASVTTELAKLRAPVPGVEATQTTGALFSIGAAIDLGKFVAWGGGVARDLRARPFSCPLLGFANEAARLFDELLSSPLVGFMRGFRGSTFSLEAVDPKSKSVVADVTLVGDNLGGLVSMLTGFIPQLSGVSIEPDGQPVEIPVSQFDLGWVTSAHVALTDDRLAISVGPGSHDRVRARLAVKPPKHSPLATMSGHAERFQKALEALGEKPDDKTDDNIGDFAIHLDVTDAGIAVDLVGSW